MNSKLKNILMFLPSIILVLATVLNIFSASPVTKAINSTSETQSTGITARSAIKTPGAVTEPKEQTIMLYLVGTDLESQNNAASYNLDVLMNAGVDTSKCNFVVFTGGCRSWGFSAIPTDAHSVLLLDNDSFYFVDMFELSNMGDPGTLTAFLNYTYETFPAEKYSLILWDHGGGPMLGYGVDEMFDGDLLTMSELRKAMDDSVFSKQKLEWIGFDACLMGSIETAGVFADYAKYMIASQEVESSFGWDYTAFKDIAENNSDGAEAGRLICQKTVESLKKLGAPYEYQSTATMSCMDLSKFSTVEDAVDDLFDSAENDIKENYVTYSKSRHTMYEYGSAFSDMNYDLVDLKSVAQSLRSLYPSKADALSSAIDSFITANVTDNNYSNGVSLLYPYSETYYYEYYPKVYESFDFADEYLEYIESFLFITENGIEQFWDDSVEPSTVTTTATTTASAEESTTSESTTTPPDASQSNDDFYTQNEQDDSMILSVNLGDAIRDTFLSAKKRLYGLENDNYYLFTSLGDTMYDDDGTLTADFNNSVYYIESAGKRIHCAMIEVSRTEDAVYCIIPAMLSRTGATIFGDMVYQGVAVNLLVVFDSENPDGTVQGAYFNTSDMPLPAIEL